MKIKGHWMMSAALLTLLALQPLHSRGSVMAGGSVTGLVTATPVSGSIEVAHHTYHVKAHSMADKVLRSITAGQMVELLLDGPASSERSEVLIINPRESQTGARQ